MGCTGSRSDAAKPKLMAAPVQIVTLAPALATTSAAPYRRRRPPWVGKRFQVKLAGVWTDYDKDEDIAMTRAFLVGHPNCRFTLKGTKYECNFKKMTQVNLDTGRVRNIRPPPGLRPPKTALLPVGPMIVITVQKGQPGKTLSVDDPNNPGQNIHVAVPASAQVGSKLAVPVPKKGEKVADVSKRQQAHSLGSKVAIAGAAAAGLGAVAVGGLVLGDHLAGGDAAEDVGEWVEDGGEDMIGWLGDAGDTIGDFLTDLF